MTNRFFAGQTNYIEEMNALDGETGDHIADATGAHAATAISNTPAGNIAATTVQAAINELDTEKLSASATTLPASFTASSLTSVGTLTSLTTTGSVGIGGAAPATTVLRLSKQGTGGTIAFGQDIQTQVQSDVTNSYSSVRSVSSTAAAAFTLSQFNHFSAVQGVLGAGSAVTNQMGFEAQSSLTGAANNFGFYSNLASGSGRWNFYAAGTADNYFAGSVGVGGAAFASAKLMLTGTAPASGTLSFGHYNGLTLDPAVTSSAYLNYTVPAIATGGTVGTLAHYFVAQGVFTGTATNQYGFAVGSTMTGATNNFGFHSAIASGANRWNFYAAGTAANYFQGDTTFASQAIFAAGSAAAPSVKVGAEQNGLYSSASNTLDVTLNGVRQAQFSYTAAAVNYLKIAGAPTGGALWLDARGSDANVSILYSTRGSGSHVFASGNSATNQFVIAHVANAVNCLQAAGNSTGAYPSLRSIGSDTNVGLDFSTQGAAPIRFYTAAFGAEQFRVASVASAVNYLQAAGSTPGNAVSMTAGGSDANIPFAYYTKGSGSHLFFANSGLQMLVGATASSVNYWQFFGAATTGELNMYADGADTNIAVVQNTKGTGSHFFRTNGGAQTQLEVAHVASAVNRLQIGGAAALISPYLIAVGSDTNINIYYGAKGSGSHAFASGAGLIQFKVNHAASAVNCAVITGGATGLRPKLYVDGTDTNIGLNFAVKGTGSYRFDDGAGIPNLLVSAVTSAVNYPVLTSSATGNAVTISTGGSDSNRSITIGAAGTGSVIFQAAGASVMAVGQWSGADKALYILNTTTAPSANPTGGGYLYCEGGALKYRGSSGTITTIAAA